MRQESVVLKALIRGDVGSPVEGPTWGRADDFGDIEFVLAWLAEQRNLWRTQNPESRPPY